MPRIFLTLVALCFSVGFSFAQPEGPRVLNDEFHKAILHVVNVIPQADNYAIVYVKEIRKKSEDAHFTPLKGEYFLANFFYTTNPTRQQEKFRELGFDLPGVRQGDIISCQLLGDPSLSDTSKANWKVYEYVIIGNEALPVVAE